MRSVVRRLLPACLLAGSALLAVGGPVGPAGAAPVAPAPKCERATIAEHTQNAQAVFSGVVDSVDQRAGSQSDPLIVNNVTVDLVYKGRISTETVPVVTRPPNRRSQGLGPLEQGEQYLFFVRVLPTDEPAYIAGGCGGTDLAAAGLVTRVEELLGAGRPPVPPEAPPVQFDNVDDSDPASFTRVAAPGLALVLVGLLGLLVVGRLGRRSV